MFDSQLQIVSFPPTSYLLFSQDYKYNHFEKMYKVLVLIALVTYASAGALNAQVNPIEGIVSPVKYGDNPIDWCPECINGFGDLIDGVLNVILQVGVLNSCGDLCDLVANKTDSDFIGFLCMVGCDVFGIKEFIKLIEGADLDPIYYCEVINLCPSKIAFIRCY